MKEFEEFSLTCPVHWFKQWVDSDNPYRTSLEPEQALVLFCHRLSDGKVYWQAGMLYYGEDLSPELNKIFTGV